jgi:hypothetical protein
MMICSFLLVETLCDDADADADADPKLFYVDTIVLLEDYENQMKKISCVLSTLAVFSQR